MSAISKQFIDFTSEIISDNYSIDMNDIKDKLSTKENKDKFANFIKSNKIKQKKDKKDKKESDEPDKFKTAYNLFSKDFRQNLVDENPGITIGETASLLGKKWEEIKEKTPAIYNKYVDESERQKVEYEEKMVQYRIDNNLPEKIKKVKKPKDSADGGGEKNSEAKNPFYYFLKENSVIVKNENPKMTQHNIYLNLREKWHESKNNKDEIYLKYKEIAKEKKSQSVPVISPPSPSTPVQNPSTPVQHPSTPVQTRNKSPSPKSSPEETQSPIQMKTPSPKKKSGITSPGGLSPSKYLSSPPVVESLKKKKSKKTKVVKEKKVKQEEKDKKKKKKKVIVVSDSSSSESDSE